MKKLICLISLLLVFALMLCACGESVSVVGAMINENGELVVTMSDGTTKNVGKVTGEDGKDGDKGEKGDTGKTGEKGEKGDAGSSGVIPQLRVNSATGMWDVSYDSGLTWISTETKAQGNAGVPGITPQLRINATTGMWEASYDNGGHWTSLGVSGKVLRDFEVSYKWTEEGEFAVYTITMSDGSVVVKEYPMLKQAKNIWVKDISVIRAIAGQEVYPVLTVEYVDGSEGTVVVTPDMIVTGSIDFTRVGACNITIFYNGAYVDTCIWVLDQDGEDIALSGNIIYQNGISETASTNDFATNANGGIYGQDIDYPVAVSQQIRDKIMQKTGLSTVCFTLKNDTAVAGPGDVLVGCTDYPETKLLLEILAPNEYAICVQSGKLIIAAWNDVALAAALNDFSQIIAGDSLIAVNGQAVFQDWQHVTGSVETNWVTDFPYPSSENIALTATQDVGDDSLLHVFTGTGVNRNAYVAYCNQLVAAGYTLHGTAKQLEGSSFATYVNSTKGVVLQVSHLAYTHATAQGVDLYEPAIRVVSASTNYVTLPYTDIMDPNLAYIKICESTITSMKFDYAVGSWGSGYIIRLEDGSFVIVDGGAALGWDDHRYLFNTLKNLYLEVFPENTSGPTANNPLHIRAWILTHEHYDKFNLFKRFVENYGAQSWLRIDYLLSNFTSAVECYNTTNPEYKIRNSLTDLQDKVVNGFDYIKVHTGQTFYFANLKIETLYTHEDLYPTRLAYFNNSSSVFRLTFTHNGTDADSFLVLGDAERLVSKHLRAMYGSALESDMVQVAAHGYNGVEAALYDLVNPTIVWFPSSTSRYTSCSSNPNSSSWMYVVNYHLCWEIASVKLIIMADTWDTTMSFKNGRADMDSLYDINNSDADVRHDNAAVIYTEQR